MPRKNMRSFELKAVPLHDGQHQAWRLKGQIKRVMPQGRSPQPAQNSPLWRQSLIRIPLEAASPASPINEIRLPSVHVA